MIVRLDLFYMFDQYFWHVPCVFIDIIALAFVFPKNVGHEFDGINVKIDTITSKVVVNEWNLIFNLL